MSAPHRRGACPGLSDPMPTGDGLLARLTPAGGTIALDAFASMCCAARRHGNGVIEITRRGSIQIRGLTPASAPLFAETIAALRIGAAERIPVIAHPLTGLDANESFDANALAAELRTAFEAAPQLSTLGPKISVVIDGGGALHLDSLSADVRLRAQTPPYGVRLHIAVGGDAATASHVGAVAVEHAADATLRILGMIAAHGPLARARALTHAGGAGQFKAAIADYVIDIPAPKARPPAEPIGAHRLRDGNAALGIGLAFGHSDASALEKLIKAVAAAGGSGFRTAPNRALLIVGLAPQTIETLMKTAVTLGFIVRADDPRRRIAACPGAPYCASGFIPARALAAQIAQSLAPARESVAIHVSGCAKGCAHPEPCALTIVGTEKGCGIVRDGSARATPRYHVAQADIMSEIATISATPREAAHG